MFTYGAFWEVEFPLLSKLVRSAAIPREAQKRKEKKDMYNNILMLMLSVCTPERLGTPVPACVDFLPHVYRKFGGIQSEEKKKKGFEATKLLCQFDRTCVQNDSWISESGIEHTYPSRQSSTVVDVMLYCWGLMAITYLLDALNQDLEKVCKSGNRVQERWIAGVACEHILVG